MTERAAGEFSSDRRASLQDIYFRPRSRVISLFLGAALLMLPLGCRGGSGPTSPGEDGSTTVSGSLITNLKPTAYEKDTLHSGDSVYVDRDYSIVGVPTDYEGWRYVRTANDDKGATDNSAVTFTLKDTARMALAYDIRATTLPDWLADWTATGDTLHTTDVDHLVYTRHFFPGDVTLGGNLSGGAQGAQSMYVLFATRSDSVPDSDSATATGSLKVITSTGGDSLDSDGYSVSVDGGSGQAIGINDTTVYSELTSEDHSVALSGVAANCSITGDNPRNVTIPKDSTASTSFAVSCEASDGGSSDAQPAWTDDFESGSEDFAADDDSYGWRHGDNATDIEVNQDQANSGSYSLMVRFPEDKDDTLQNNGTWDDPTGINRKPLWQIPRNLNLQEIWFEYYLYVPDNYAHPAVENSSENRKFWAVWDDNRIDEDVSLFIETFTGDEDTQSPPRSSEFRVFMDTDESVAGGTGNWYSDGSGDGCGVQACIGDVLEVEDRGTWIQLRIHFKLASSRNTSDGQFHVWKDGNLIMQDETLPAYPSSDGNYFLHEGQILGAQNSPYHVETRYYLDDVTIYDQDPGW